MSYTVFKTFGNQDYAYEIRSYWDKTEKKVKKESTYLGVVIDKEKKIYEKKERGKRQEKLILDFGDSFIIQEILSGTNFIPLIEEIFTEDADTLLSLLTFRMCYTGAMMYAETWYEGSYAKFQYKNAKVSSQRISDFLKVIGEEQIQRSFFRDYLSGFSKAKKGVIIDATSLPNQIHNPLTAWGRSGEEIDKQIRFLLVVDKETGAPLYFRTLPGNIIDVSTLVNTFDELQRYNIKDTFVYMDAGFFSEDNIKEMYANKLQFLTRLPSGRVIYKELIRNDIKDLESPRHAVKYGMRGLFIKQKEMDLFGKKAYVHIVLDPERKGREMTRLVLESADEKSENMDELEYEYMTRGIMILVSSFEIPKKDVVPLYYTRQMAEMLFGFSKDDLGALPLRVHSEAAIHGLMFLQFITLIAFTQLKNKFGKDYTVEEVLINMRNLKCKVYKGEIVTSELTKKQKEITKMLDIMVPKTLGI